MAVHLRGAMGTAGTEALCLGGAVAQPHLECQYGATVPSVSPSEASPHQPERAQL